MENRKNQALELKNDGDKLYQKQLFEEALKLYLNAIDLDPLQIETYLNISKTFIKLEKIDDALSYFDKSLKITPQEKHTNLRKGVSGIFWNAKKYQEAFQVFHPIYTENKDNENAFQMLKYSISSKNFNVASEILIQENDKIKNLEKLIEEDDIPELELSEFLKTQSDIIGEIKKTSNNLISDTNIIFEQTDKFLSNNQKYKELKSQFQDLQNDFSKCNNFECFLKVKDKLTNFETIKYKILTKELLETRLEIQKSFEKKIDFLNSINQYYTNKEQKEQNDLFISQYNEIKNIDAKYKLEIILNSFIKAENLAKELENWQTNNEQFLDKMVDENLKSRNIGVAKKINSELKNFFPENKKYIENERTIKIRLDKKKELVVTKLKRNKIKSYLDENILIIGKAKVGIADYLGRILVPVIFIAGLIFVQVRFEFLSRFITFLIILLSFSLITGIFIIIKRKFIFSDTKIFADDRIIFETKKNQTELKKEQITNIKTHKDNSNNGSVIIVDIDKKEHTVLYLMGKDYKYLQDDLEYFKTFLTEMYI